MPNWTDTEERETLANTLRLDAQRREHLGRMVEDMARIACAAPFNLHDLGND